MDTKLVQFIDLFCSKIGVVGFGTGVKAPGTVVRQFGGSDW